MARWSWWPIAAATTLALCASLALRPANAGDTDETAPAYETVAPGEAGNSESIRPTYSAPSVPPIDNSANQAAVASPSGMQEIPQALPEETPVAVPPDAVVPQANDVNNYLNEDQDLSGGYIMEGDQASALGFDCREARGTLKTGEQTEGLMIVHVEKDSAAAKAGLRPYKHIAHNVITGAAIGAALVFPPAILILPVVEYTEVGESYDMIIGVDGQPVHNFVDFEDRMRYVQPGELVYFNVVRGGKRLQIAVPVPMLPTSASN